ncbi:MAG: CPBP family intramembrane metalloprotease [Burkholderiales bacterium]|nr:CPBP family intramembrane metalloprotease [Burkholderiales bacterium]
MPYPPPGVPPMTFPLPFVLLALAIALVWAPSLRVGTRRLSPWTFAFGAACIAGALVAPPVLSPPALAALALLAALAWGGVAAPRWRCAITVLAALLALALSLHLLPGFHPAWLFRDVHLTADAAPFGLALGFDKAAAGLLLLAAFSVRVTTWRQLAAQLPTIAAAALATAAVSIGIALAAGYVRFAPKWSEAAPAFLLANLFFTCVAEEAFFRGLIQERLMRLAEARRQPAWNWIALAVSTVLFGLAHAGGGATWLLVATVAGLGYSLVYARTRTIEGVILVHFLVNAAHFLLFTYPRLAA